jgi:hypothetical protein
MRSLTRKRIVAFAAIVAATQISALALDVAYFTSGSNTTFVPQVSTSSLSEVNYSFVNSPSSVTSVSATNDLFGQSSSNSLFTYSAPVVSSSQSSATSFLSNTSSSSSSSFFNVSFGSTPASSGYTDIFGGGSGNSLFSSVSGSGTSYSSGAGNSLFGNTDLVGLLNSTPSTSSFLTAFWLNGSTPVAASISAGTPLAAGPTTNLGADAPEPSTLILLAAGLSGVALLRRRRAA